MRKVIKEVHDIGKQFSVGVATESEGELSNIKYLVGTKQECIDFINNEILSRLFLLGCTTKVVINLAFDANEFSNIFSKDDNEEKEKYKHNLERWYTIQELEEIGAISVK